MTTATAHDELPRLTDAQEGLLRGLADVHGRDWCLYFRKDWKTAGALVDLGLAEASQRIGGHYRITPAGRRWLKESKH